MRVTSGYANRTGTNHKTRRLTMYHKGLIGPLLVEIYTSNPWELIVGWSDGYLLRLVIGPLRLTVQ